MRRSGSANRRRVPFGDPAEVCRILAQLNVTSTTYQLSVAQLAKGAYWVSVRGSTNGKVKKLIIH